MEQPPYKYLSRSAHQLLSHLLRNPFTPVSVTTLAGETGLESFYVSNTLRRLREAQWVIATEREGNQRIWWYQLTDLARTEGPKLLERWSELGKGQPVRESHRRADLDEDAIVAEHERGDSCAEIGKRQGVHRTTISRRLRELGYPARSRSDAVALKANQGAQSLEEAVSLWLAHHGNHVTLWSTRAKARTHLARRARHLWHQVAGKPGVPEEPPAEDDQAIEQFYGDDYTIRPLTVDPYYNPDEST